MVHLFCYAFFIKRSLLKKKTVRAGEICGCQYRNGGREHERIYNIDGLYGLGGRKIHSVCIGI